MKRKLMGILLVIFLLCGVGLYANYVIQNIDINVSEEDPDPTPLDPASPKTPLIVLKDNYTVFSYDALGLPEGVHITNVSPGGGFKDTLKYEADDTNRILSLFCNNTFSTATDLFIFTSGATYTRSFVCVNRKSFTLAQDAITFVNQEVMNHIKVSDHDPNCDKAVKDFNFTNVYSYCSDRLKVSEVENNSFTLVGNNATPIDDTNPIYIIDLNNDKIGYQYACIYKSEIDTKEPIEVAVGQTWDATGEKGGFFADKRDNGGSLNTKPVIKCIAPADYVSYTNTDQTKGTFTKAGKITMFTIRQLKSSQQLVTYTINIKEKVAPTKLTLSQTLLSKNINSVNKNASQGASIALGLEVKMEGKEGYCEDVVWSSSDTEVLSFDDKGIPTAHKLGYTEITCTSAVNPKATDSCDYYVTLNPTSSTTYIGKESTMNSVSPDDGSASISAMDITSIDSEDKNIITARIDGKVIKFTGVSEGTTRLIVTTANATKYASVSCYKIEGPYAVGQEVILSVDDFANLSEKANKNIPTDRKISTEEKSYIGGEVTEDGRFKIDTSVAKENLGVFITLSDDPEKEKLPCYYAFKVYEPVVSITLDPTEMSLVSNNSSKNSKSINVTVKGKDDQTTPTDKSVKWESSDEDIAKVSDAGKVTAVENAIGEAIITCSSVSDPDVKATCTVNVVKEVEEITVDPTEVGLIVDATKQLTATVLPTDAAVKDLEWYSGNTNVATVNKTTGLVTAVAKGTTNIYAKATDGSDVQSNWCEVTVKVPVTSIEIPKKLELKIDSKETDTLTATVLPTTATQTVKWYSKNTSVATVNEDTGLVMAVDEGTCEIYAKATDGTDVESKPCEVTVKVDVKTITLDPDKYTLITNDNSKKSVTIKATVEGAGGKTPTDPSVTWNSSKESVATVDENGTVTAVANGSTTITCTSVSNPSVSATCEIEVKTNVESITIPETLELKIDSKNSDTLTATVLPETSSVQTVKWYSKDTSVATVNEDTGLVTAVDEGTCKIYAKATDGTDVESKPCEVTVKVDVNTITLDPDEYTLITNDNSKKSVTIKATVEGPGGKTPTDSSVTWKSSKDSFATVDENGTVTAVANGNTTITCTSVSNPGVSATCEIKVKTNVESITIPETLELKIDSKNSDTLTATVLPETSSVQTVKWYSNDTSVATVNEDTGVVTAVANGTANITAKATDGTDVVSKPCIVTVTTDVKSITVTPTTLPLIIGKTETGTLSATVSPTTASVKTVKWYSNDTSVVTVNEDTGLVTAVANGSTTVYAKSTDGTDITSSPVCTVSVTTAVTGVELDIEEATVKPDETLQLTATITPETASNKKVTWSTSDDTIASVDQTGLVTAHTPGTATITVTTDDGGYTATCEVTTWIYVESVSLNKKKLYFEVGESEKLYATINPSDAMNKNVSWVSSDPSVAYVSQVGKVYAKGRGTATITVITEDGNKKDYCKVYVTQPVKSVKLSSHKLNMVVGERAQIHATVLPEDANDKTVYWSSSNTKVATVDGKGRIKAKSKGRATITVITKDGNKKDHCVVYVK